MSDPREKLMVALDVPSVHDAIGIISEVDDLVGGYKLGLEFWTSTNTDLMIMSSAEALGELDLLHSFYKGLRGRFFFDGKFHDIENTVKGAVKGVLPLKPRFVNVHASASMGALKAAVLAAGCDTKVLGVTVLTDIKMKDPERPGRNDCVEIFGADQATKVRQFAERLVEADAYGVICAATELQYLEGVSLFKVTPAIRPVWALSNDQDPNRVMTAGKAVKAGSDLLIIGRPITNAAAYGRTRRDACMSILDEIAAAS